MNGNRLTGTIPTHLGRLTSMISLFVFFCSASGLRCSPRRSECSSFSDNLMSGTIPTEIGLLSVLTEM
jgi:hypothetical protein